MPLTLDLLPHRYAVCRLAPDAVVDRAWFGIKGVVSVTRTDQELSLVIPEMHAPPAARCERGFRALRVHGPLAFELTGILAGLATTLANEHISIFAISTFDTDFVLVRGEDLEKAVAALQKEGHEVDVKAEG
jgi:hypothetical protein